MNNIEAIQSVSPVQESMLRQLNDGHTTGAYQEQLICVLRGALNVSAFARAWQHVFEAHGFLRSFFVGKRGRKPQQVILKLELPLRQHDWRTQSEAELRESFETLLRTERGIGFDPHKAPLMRLILCRTDEETFRFVWHYHRLLLDRESAFLIFREVLDIYENFSAGNDALPAQHPQANYTGWLKQQELSLAEEFWRRELTGRVTPTVLSAEVLTNDKRATSSPMVEEQLPLAEATANALKDFAQEHQLSLETLLLAAWALLLSRHSRESELVLGVTANSREIALDGAESMLGSFSHTLPVHVSIDGTTRVLSWLKEYEARLVQRKKYEYVSLDQVASWNGVADISPVHEKYLVLDVDAETELLTRQVKDLELCELRIVGGETNPLTLGLSRHPELTLRLTYDSRQFTGETAKRMLGNLQTLLANMVAQPEERFSQLPLLSPAELQLSLYQWNSDPFSTPSTAPSSLSLHQLFERQATRTPQATALISGSEHLSYADLDGRANQLAHLLRARGLGPERCAALLLTRRSEMVVALLAVLKAGGSYLPLETTYPHERLRFMLQDAQATLLITEESLLDLAAELLPTPQDDTLPEGDLPVSLPARSATTTVVCLEDEHALVARQPQTSPGITLSPLNMAYIIYTSGSTGRPKGVVITHRNAVTLVLWANQYFNAEQLAGVLFATSISFDLSIFEMFVPWSVGGTVIMADNALQLPEVEGREAVTLVNTVPSAMAELVRTGALPAGVRTVNLAGEALTRELVEQVYAVETVKELVNLYGPTEDTTYSTYALMQRGEGGTPEIGRGIARTQVYVLDKWQQPVPVGVTGELYIGGEGLARGYWQRPELTAERFVPDPFGASADAFTGVGAGADAFNGAGVGGRLYRTGDLVRWTDSGTLAYVGRLDYQVKVRGYRVELGEVEAVVRQASGVREAVVEVEEREGGEKWLICYLVMGEGSQATELRGWMKERVPEYMVPQAWVQVEEMPLTANGKIDRRALSLAGEQIQVGVAEVYAGPRTAIEEMLVGIWAEVLRVERVGIYDNFFELGGHSLLATLLMSRVRAAFKVELPVRSLFEQPTVAGIAARIESAIRAGEESIVETIKPTSRTAALPLSFSQQRLWFLDQLVPQSPFFNMPSAVRLIGRLNMKALERTLNALIKRHESLRTSFPMVEGRAVQVISEAAPIDMRVIDLKGMAASERETEVQKLTTEEARRPFDLEHGPLFRVTLLQIDDEDHMVLLTLHHIISDGWSMGVLISEVGQLYEAYSNNRVATLPELPIQYADYAVWQRGWLQGAVLEKQLDYWRTQLSGVPPVLNLPITKPRREMQGHTAAQESLWVPLELVKSLKELSRRESVTLFMTMLATFQTLLSWYTKRRDIVIGTPIAGRNRSETEHLIGFFVNVLVIRTDLSGDPTFRELLGRVREVSLGAYAHQDLPFEKLVDELAPERSMSYAPLVQVMVVMQNNPPTSLHLSGLELRYPDARSENARTDLKLSLSESEQGLNAVMLYNVELFDAVSITHMIQYLDALLRYVVAHPDATLSVLFEQLDEMSAGHRSVTEQEFKEAGLQQLKGARRRVLSNA